MECQNQLILNKALPQDRNKIWVEDGETLDWMKGEAKRENISETPIERNDLDLQVTNEIA